MKKIELKKSGISAERSTHSGDRESLQKNLDILKRQKERLLKCIARGETDQQENLDKTIKRILATELKLKKIGENLELASSQQQTIPESKGGSKAPKLGFAQEAAKLNHSQQKKLHEIEELDHELKEGLLRGGKKIGNESSTLLKIFGLLYSGKSTPPENKPEAADSQKKSRECWFGF